MTSKTHIAAGTMVSTMICFPHSIKLLAIGLTASTIGSVISDIDVSTSESHKDLTKICFISFIMLILCTFIELKFNIGLYKIIEKHTNLSNILSGLILFLIVCYYGMHKPHRTFMHSLLCVLILSLIVHSILDIATLPFAIGMLSHIFLDLFNRKRVKLLYPLNYRIKFDLCDSDGIINNTLCILSTMILGIELFIFFINYI